MAAFLTVLTGSTLFVLQRVSEVRQASAEVRTRLQPTNDSALALVADVIDQETGSRGFVITGNDTFLVPYRNGRAGATRNLRTLRVLAAEDPQITGALDDVEASLGEWQAVAAEPEIRAVEQGDATGARELVASGAGQQRFDRLRSQLAELQELLGDRRTAANERVRQANETLSRTVLGTSLVLIGFGAGMGALLFGWVLVPIRRLQMSLRRVAGGQIEAAVPVTGPPEIADLSRDAENMRRRILAELAASVAAREALEQRGPVVTGLREQLVPSVFPSVHGVLVSAALEPAEGLLAGDWYDVLPLADGRIALVIADISGHGAEAGLVAARAKHVLRSGLRLGLSPHEALSLVSEDFASEDERFASCLIVEIDPASGTGRWANAGHPAAVVVMRRRERVDQTRVMHLPMTGPLLSSLGGAWGTRDLRLEPGDLLLAYTDGVTEARDANGQEFGEEGVLAAIQRLKERTPEAAVAACVAAAREHAADLRRDDVTVIALAIDPAVHGSRVVTDVSGDDAPGGPRRAEVRRSLELAVDLRSVSVARTFVQSEMPPEARPETVASAILLVSELVTNALRHAVSPVTVVVVRTPATVRIEVEDGDADSAPRMRGASEEAEGGRGLVLVDALATQWGTDVVGDGKRVWVELGTG